jgi:hypothetical protein
MNILPHRTRIILLIASFLLTIFTFTGTGCRILKRDKESEADKKAEEANKKGNSRV